MDDKNKLFYFVLPCSSAMAANDTAVLVSRFTHWLVFDLSSHVILGKSSNLAQLR